MKFTRWLLDSPPPPTYKKAVPTLADRIDRWQEFEFVAPAVVLQWVGAIDAGTGAYDQGKRDGGFSMRIFHALTPETETTCHVFWSALNGFRPRRPAGDADDVRRGRVGVQGRPVDRSGTASAADRMRRRRLVNIVADGARVHMRRVLEKMVARESGSGKEAAGV